MYRYKILYFKIFLLGFAVVVNAQVEKKPGLTIDTTYGHLNSKNYKRETHAFFELQTIGTTNSTVPFWMRSNLFGSKPLAGLSTAFIGGIKKDYRQSTQKIFDWGMGVELRANVGTKAEAILTEAYVKGRIGVFQLKAGRSKDIIGLVDSTLSTGAFSVSGNALGIPKVELSIPTFYYLPFFRKFIAIKGSLAHGWMGETPLTNPALYNYLVNTVNSYYHQFTADIQFGKVGSKVKLYGGISHVVMWGHEKEIYGPQFNLSSLEEYFYILIGKAYGNNTVPSSKIGNHLGSIDQGISINIGNVDLMGYHQFFYDIGGLGHLSNVKDGTWGVSFKNKRINNKINWNKLLLEFISSKSQGGEPYSRPTPSGAEDYYNNSLYSQGWTYKGENIGNPLFTNINYARKGLPRQSYQYIINNRITALHLGIEATLKDWKIITKLTYSHNYGTWSTAPSQRRYDTLTVINTPPYFQKENQFSGLVEASKPLKNGYSIGGVFALDIGTLLYNSAGISLKISKSFD